MAEASAIVPVYNAENTLKRAIDSLLIQPEINQIILVEDGSSDSSLSICKDLESSYPHISLHTHPNNENKGAPASRNLGLEYAQNDWIQFMDADDQLLSGKVGNQLKLVDNSIGLVVGGFIVKENGTSDMIKPHADVWSGLISTRLGLTISNLWNKRLIEQAGRRDETLLNVQEYHLMFEMLKINEQVAFSDPGLTLVFPQPDSITNSKESMHRKRDTYFLFRNMVKDHLVSQNRFTLRRRHYYSICTGINLSYHQPEFPVHYDSGYYKIYKGIKSMLSKLKISSST